MKKTALLTVSILGAALLAGCGGGGGDDASTGTPLASPEGVYGGTFDKAGSTEYRMVVLEGNASSRPFWMVYGDDDPVQGFIAKGLVQGNGATTSFANVTTFTSVSSSTKDFGESPAADAVLSSNFTVGGGSKTISGTVTVTGVNPAINFASAAFTGSSTYNYNTAALLATVADTWTVTGLASETYTLVIDPDGTFDATPNVLPGCEFSGALTPRSSGKNVFNVTLVNGAGCTSAGTSTGIALAYDVGGGVTQLVLGVVNAGRTGSAVLFGTKP